MSDNKVDKTGKWIGSKLIRGVYWEQDETGEWQPIAALSGEPLTDEEKRRLRDFRDECKKEKKKGI